MRHAHSTPATARGRFDHYWKTYFPCDFDCVALCLDNSIAARRHGHAGFSRRSARCIFVAHRLHSVRRRSNELDIAAFTDFREMRVLSEKSISGMNRIDFSNLGSTHDSVELEITFRAGCRPNANGFVCKLHVQ